MRRVPRAPRSLVATLLVLLAIGLIAIWYRETSRSVTPAEPGSPSATISSRETSKLPAPGPARHSSALDAWFAQLQRAELPPETLAARRAELLEADPRAVLDGIRQFLGSGRDETTGAPFAIAAGGGDLATAPTFRVWLLDLAGVLDRTAQTGEAAAISREILRAKGSPDEWAVALRNIAWTDPASTPYLAAKFREMAGYAPWASAPTAGFLEAFDIAVFSRDPALIPVLADFLQGAQPSLRRAAGVALDRLAENAALPVMNYLNSHPQILADRPMLRADYFAKADLATIAERAALETYLMRGDVLLPEKTKLIKALAAPGSFISDNLLTSSPDPTTDGIRSAGLDRALSEWRAANRFPELAPVLAQVQGRLNEH